MTISFANALSIHPQALALESTRMEVISNNIANVDTPGFKARDIDFRKYLNAIDSNKNKKLIKTDKTHAHHMPISNLDEIYSVNIRASDYPSMDGNTVNSEVEYTKFTESAIRYEAILQFLKGRFSGLKYAIKGN